MKTVNIRTHNRLQKDYELLKKRYVQSLDRNKKLLRLVKIQFGKVKERRVSNIKFP